MQEDGKSKSRFQDAESGSLVLLGMRFSLSCCYWPQPKENVGRLPAESWALRWRLVSSRPSSTKSKSQPMARCRQGEALVVPACRASPEP